MTKPATRHLRSNIYRTTINGWSHPAERDANVRAIPGAHLVTLEATGHFASLEKPEEIADLIQVVNWRGSDG